MGRRKVGFWVRLAVVVLRPLLMVLTHRDWRGGERIPRTGGVLVVVNHNSYFDPLTVAHFVWDSGRTPRFLAKASLFRLPLAGRVLAGAGQIPVYRHSSDAAKAYSAAVQAVRSGECVVIYPEGTVTRDPDLWPMVGKTGAARVALATGAPVVPVAQWGSHEILAPYAKRPRFFPRKTVRFSAGPAVELDDLRAQPLNAEVLRTASTRILAAITVQLESIRGERAPAQRFDPRAHGVPAVGDPRRAG